MARSGFDGFSAVRETIVFKFSLRIFLKNLVGFHLALFLGRVCFFFLSRFQEWPVLGGDGGATVDRMWGGIGDD